MLPRWRVKARWEPGIHTGKGGAIGSGRHDEESCPIRYSIVVRTCPCLACYGTDGHVRAIMGNSKRGNRFIRVSLFRSG